MLVFSAYVLLVALIVHVFLDNLQKKDVVTASASACPYAPSSVFPRAPESQSSPQLVASVQALYVFPIKSCHAISLQEAVLTPTGLQYDRHWMLVRDGSAPNADVAGENSLSRFITARQFPQMVTIQPSFSNDGQYLLVDATGLPTLSVPLNYSPPMTPDPSHFGVKIWSDNTFAADEGNQAAEWFNKFLSEKHPTEFAKLGSVRLVRYYPKKEKQIRETKVKVKEASNEVAFVDAHPFLLVSQESVDEIDNRVPGLKVEQARFRGNIIVSGTKDKLAPFVEETWQRVFIGKANFICTELVERCKMTTIDKGYFDESQRPLMTVNAKESNPKYFGVGLQHTKQSEGLKITVGMDLYAL